MKTTSVIAGIIFLCFSIVTNAQVTFQLGGGVGYAIAASNLAEDITYMEDSGYGMDGGINIHAKARVGLLGFIAVGEIGYTMMNADGSVGSVKYDNSLNVFTMRVGPEFHIPLPLIPIDPYVGANFQFNSFSGESEIQGMTGVASGTYDMETATRYGIGINGGAIFSLAGLKLDLNAGYNLLNVFGKDNETTSGNTFSLDDGDDDGAGESSALNTFEIKATLMFGI